MQSDLNYAIDPEQEGDDGTENHDTEDRNPNRDGVKRPTINQTVMNMLAFHDGQVDKSGVPYFNHPLRVMLRIGPDASEAEHHAALLHDVMEDCYVTRSILQDLGYSEEVIEMVELVSRIDKSVPYRQFIYTIAGSGNIGAMRIKLADLYDNSSEVRRELLPPDKRAEVENTVQTRYKPAIAMLLQCLGVHAKGVIPDEMEIDVDMKEIRESGCENLPA